MKDQKFSIKARIRSFRYSFKGIYTFFSTEHNARIHLVAALLAIATGIWLKISMLEWILIAIAITVVIVAEMLNTAIEHLTDLHSPERSKLAKTTKDIAAGSVLIAAILALIIGGCVFIPRVWMLF